MPEYKLGKLRGKFCFTWINEQGRRQRRTLGATDAREAARELDRIVKALAVGKEYTVAELWTGYRASLGNRPSAKTMGSEWPKLQGRFGHLVPSQITEALCKEHMAERRAAGKKEGTIWTELGRLRMVFAWAVKREMLDKAPYIDRPSKPPPKTLYLKRSEVGEVLAACEMPHLKLFVTLAWTTGARDAALRGLTWDRVDFDRGLIHLLDPHSTRRMKGRAVVPMNGSARAALKDAYKGRLTEYVIEYAGHQVGSVKKGLKAAGKRSGKPWISPHVFRHSAAVAMAEDGVSMSEIAQFLGHSDSRLTERVYARFSPDYLQKAARSLELEPATPRLKVVR
jgi:integrase